MTPNWGQLVADAWEFSCYMGRPKRMTKKRWRDNDYVFLWNWRTDRAGWRRL